MSSFRFDEKHLSQIPALQLLANLGYRYLTPAQALTMRGGRLSNVLLEEVLRDSLKRINRIQHKGDSYLFSEENLQSAIQRLKNVKYDGLLKTNEAVYDLLTLGVALARWVARAGSTTKPSAAAVVPTPLARVSMRCIRT